MDDSIVPFTGAAAVLVGIPASEALDMSDCSVSDAALARDPVTDIDGKKSVVAVGIWLVGAFWASARFRIESDTATNVERIFRY